MNYTRILFVAALLVGTAMACTSKQRDPSAAGLQEMRSAKKVAVHERLLAPMSLSLNARPGDETVELTAVLHVNGRLPIAPVLKIHVSEADALLEGLAEETLGRYEPGSAVERRFVVRAGSVPIRVTADVVTKGMGAHAEAQWPEATPASPSAVEMTPVAPVKIRGVVIDKAVEVRSKNASQARP